MANVLVCGVKVPFTSGGQEVLVRALLEALKARGHRADLVELPYVVQPKEEILNQAAMWRAYDFSAFSGYDVDLIITTKFPSYFAKHKRKSIWLVHQHRAIYDLYCSRYSDFTDSPQDEALRRRLMQGDTKVIGEADYVAGISENVVKRLGNYNGIAADVLYPPLPMAGRYRHGETKDYILSVGRLCSIKRVDLLIKSTPVFHSFVKVKIVGTPDEPGIMDYFVNEIKKHHLTDRIEFLGRVSDEELLTLYGEALAVCYVPHNEDYGFVTLEAFASGRPVISANDSGGVLEFVRHEENGLVVEPTPDAIGHAINRLIENKEFAEQLGARGRELIERLSLDKLGWDRVIDGLLSPLAG